MPRKPSSKRAVPKRKSKKPKGSFRKKLLVTGVAATIAVGAAVGVRAHRRHATTRRAEVAALRKAFSGSEVRNSAHWARVCQVYGWNPANAADLKKIQFIESVSKKVGVPPARVLETVEVNTIDRNTAQAIHNSIRGRGNRLSAQGIARRQRIIDIINAFVENPDLVREVQGTSGGLEGMRGIK